jgi:hypothetical protein
MEIRNAIIITDDETTLKMPLDEQRNFTGNVIFSRDKLPSSLAREIYAATGYSSEHDAAPTDHSRVPVKPELVG